MNCLNRLNERLLEAIFTYYKGQELETLVLYGAGDEARLGFASRSESFAIEPCGSSLLNFLATRISLRGNELLCNSCFRKLNTSANPLSCCARIKRAYGFSFQKLRFFQRKALRTLLACAGLFTKLVRALTLEKSSNK